MKSVRAVLGGVIVIALLVGCGGSGQDEPSTLRSFGSVYTGQVIDGYVARALVFVDTNNNGSLELWEAHAFTDNDGYYSYNPLTNTEYCASDATDLEAQYCLRTNLDEADPVIRIAGGYDVLTGEPFEGQMSRRILTSQGEGITSLTITPLSSLFTDVTDVEDRATLLQKLGLNEADLNVDYIDSDAETSGTQIEPEILRDALKLHRALTAIDTLFESHYEDVTDVNDFRVGGEIQRRFAEQLIEGNHASLDELLNDETAMLNLVSQIEQQVRVWLDDDDVTLPEELYATPDNQNLTRQVVKRAADMSQHVETALAGDSLSYTQARSGSRSLEVLARKVTEEIKQRQISDDPDASSDAIQETIAFLESAEGADLRSILGRDNLDLSLIIEHDYSDDVANASLDENATISDTALGTIAERMLRIELDDSGDKVVEIYFNRPEADNADATEEDSGQTEEGASQAEEEVPAEEVTEGFVSACLRYIKTDDLGNPEESATNTEGMFVTGRWAYLDKGRFNVLVVMDILDAEYRTIIKSAGDRDGNPIFRFDYDGELTTWFSETGVTTQEESGAPASDEECQIQLTPTPEA